MDIDINEILKKLNIELPIKKNEYLNIYIENCSLPNNQLQYKINNIRKETIFGDIDFNNYSILNNELLETKLNFLPMSAIGEITGFDKKPKGISPVPAELIEKISLRKNNEMYHRIDTVIFDCIGQTMTFTQLLQHIKTTDPNAYEYVIGHAQQILNPTYALS